LEFVKIGGSSKGSSTIVALPQQDIFTIAVWLCFGRVQSFRIGRLLFAGNFAVVVFSLAAGAAFDGYYKKMIGTRERGQNLKSLFASAAPNNSGEGL
jgi:hypothetical protein